MAIEKLVGKIEGISDAPACTRTEYMNDITYTTNVKIKVEGEIEELVRAFGLKWPLLEQVIAFTQSNTLAC